MIFISIYDSTKLFIQKFKNDSEVNQIDFPVHSNSKIEIEIF